MKYIFDIYFATLITFFVFTNHRMSVQPGTTFLLCITHVMSIRGWCCFDWIRCCGVRCCITLAWHYCWVGIWARMLLISIWCSICYSRWADDDGRRGSSGGCIACHGNSCGFLVWPYDNCIITSSFAFVYYDPQDNNKYYNSANNDAPKYSRGRARTMNIAFIGWGWFVS